MPTTPVPRGSSASSSDGMTLIIYTYSHTTHIHTCEYVYKIIYDQGKNLTVRCIRDVKMYVFKNMYRTRETARQIIMQICSHKEPEFHSNTHYDGSQLSITPISGIQHPFLTSEGTRHTRGTQIHVSKTFIYYIFYTYLNWNNVKDIKHYTRTNSR